MEVNTKSDPMVTFTDLSEDQPMDLLADELKCGICLNLFDNAVATQCGHTFCYNCVHRLLSTSGAHVICPECRDPLTTKPMTRKRTTSTRNAVIAGGLVLSVNPCRRLNAIIGKLRINCQHTWNGCTHVCPLDSMAAHLKTCEHRICRKCNLSAGRSADQHNCIELLLKERNEWKHKFEAVVKEKKELSEKLAQLSANSVVTKPKPKAKAKPKAKPFAKTSKGHILFGKYRTTGHSIEMTSDGIKLFNVGPNTNSKFKYHITLPFVEMQSLSICADQSLPLLMIKPVRDSARKIVECLVLTTHVFDVNSNDKSRNNIVIALQMPLTKAFATEVINTCKLLNSECECKTIDATEGQVLVDARN